MDETPRPRVRHGEINDEEGEVWHGSYGRIDRTVRGSGTGGRGDCRGGAGAGCFSARPTEFPRPGEGGDHPISASNGAEGAGSASSRGAGGGRAQAATAGPARRSDQPARCGSRTLGGPAASPTRAARRRGRGGPGGRPNSRGRRTRGRPAQPPATTGSSGPRARACPRTGSPCAAAGTPRSAPLDRRRYRCRGVAVGRWTRRPTAAGGRRGRWALEPEHGLAGAVDPAAARRGADRRSDHRVPRTAGADP
jgi:hypothetical protein